MSDLKPNKSVTAWYRLLKNKQGIEYWDFNHLEDGHCVNNHPTSKHPIHDSVWKGGKWSKVHVHLIGDNNVVSKHDLPTNPT